MNEDEGLTVEAVTQYVCLRCNHDMKPGSHCCNCSKGSCPECFERKTEDRLEYLPPTHERNALVWLASLFSLKNQRKLDKVIPWIALAAALALLFGCSNPMSSTDIGHPNEEAIASWAKCYYAHFGLEEKLGGPLTVAFTDERRVATCPSGMVDPPPECIAAGWAMPGSRLVTFYREWVRHPNRTPWDLQSTAAHEVCHLSGIFLDESLPDHPDMLTAYQCSALTVTHSGVTGECNGN
jgi:hypothetical protein